MSNNTTKPNTTKPQTKNAEIKTTKAKRADSKPAKKEKLVSYSHISLPGGRKLKMNFAKWVMIFTLIVILILLIVTYPRRSIVSHIKGLESKDEIVAYCIEKELNCSFTVLTDYDIEGYKVARVAFLDDDFYTRGTVTSEVADSESAVLSQKDSNSKQQTNVYITIQQGISLE